MKIVTIRVEEKHLEKCILDANSGTFAPSSSCCPLAHAAKEQFGDKFVSCAGNTILLSGGEELFCDKAHTLTVLVTGMGKQMLTNVNRVRALLPLEFEFKG